MNNDSVVKLVKAGLSEDLIISTINATPGTYDTSVDSLIALKTAGATDKVIGAVIAKNSVATSARSSGLTSRGLEPTDANDQSQPTPAASPTQEPGGPDDSGTASGWAPIPAHSRIVIAPMGGFETYFAAAVREKRVPVTLTLDKTSAQFYVVSTNTEWQGFVYGSGGSASWNTFGGTASHGAAGSSTRGLEASIMMISAKTKDIVWAYEVHKNSHGNLLFGTLGARGQQSVAEACAKGINILNAP
jgi:hypothetical protein